MPKEIKGLIIMADKEENKKVEKAKEKPAKTEKPQKKKEKPAKIEKPKKETKQKKEVKLPESDAKTVADAFNVIKFVLMTEKSVRMVETQNKLVFIVKRDAARDEIKKAVQHAFNSPVFNVKTVIDQAGRKKAFVRFANDGAAGDIAIKLGII